MPAWNRHTGRLSADNDAIMKVIRPPVFVDNAVTVGQYQSGKTQPTIKRMSSTDFQPTTGRAMEVVEQEDGMVLVSAQRPGHSYKGSPFFLDSTLVSAERMPLLYAGVNDSSQRLVPSSVAAATQGSFVLLESMTDRSFGDIGFNEKQVMTIHPVDIGLRTSDLAMKLGSNVANNLSSLTISRPSKATSDTTRAQHSTNFLAAPFRGVNLITALRYVGRASGRVVYASRFGSLMFMPFQYSDRSHGVNSYFRLGVDNKSTNFDSVNRVVVVGKKRGLNSNIMVSMNDRSTQGKSGDETIREMSSPIEDNSLTTMVSARKMAREILRSNNTLKTSRKVGGLPELWFAKAGDNVMFGDDEQPNLILDVSHDLTNKSSDITVLSIDSGLQGILQNLEENIVSSRSIEAVERTAGVVKEEMSFNFNNKFRTTLLITARPRVGEKLTLGPTGATVARGSMIGQGGFVLGVRNGEIAVIDIRRDG